MYLSSFCYLLIVKLGSLFVRFEEHVADCCDDENSNHNSDYIYGTYEEITDFARYQLNSLAEWQVESISLDGYGDMLPTYSMGAQRLYVMIPDESTVANAKQKIAEYLAQ